MNTIRLNRDQVSKIVEQLNDLLANYQVFYMNVRGFHWNIKGRNFFLLHGKFEDTYDNLLEKVDEIAERILTLGHEPLHSFGKYLEMSSIPEVISVDDGDAAVKSLLDSFLILLGKQRAILKIAGEADDEGTVAMMSDYIREQEKLIWMLESYLK